MSKFITRLKIAMERKGIKQSVLAYRIGVDRSYISNYLSGKYKPSDELLTKIAEVLNVSKAWLAGYDVPMSLENQTAIQIPVLGKVAAGIPIEAVTDIIDYEEISPDMVRDGSEYFALQLKGDSMEPKMSNGDVVIVRKQETIENGQIAIVCVNGYEATCKKVLFKDNGAVILQPLNPTHDPMYFTPDEVVSLPITILGRVVELRAKF